MKKIYLLAIGLIAAQATEAQITYEFNDLPVIGDQITRYRDTMTVYAPGPAGPNQHWMFPAPIQHETETTSVVAPSSTPHSSSFPGSNMAMTNDNSAFLFFDVNSSAMIATGVAGDLLQSGSNITVQFNPTLKIHDLDRVYDDSFDDIYYFEAIVNNFPVTIFGVTTTMHSVRLRHHGHVYDTTDGYGQITTPVGTYDCLRVKKVDFTVDSIWTKTFSFSPWSYQSSLGGPNVITTYSWLAKETKLPVAEMTFDSENNPKNLTWSSIPPTAVPTSIADADERDVRIYPQPAQGTFTVELPQGGFTTAELMTLDGRSVRSQTILDRDRLDVDIHGVAPGMYILRLLPTNGSTVVTRKVILQ